MRLPLLRTTIVFFFWPLTTKCVDVFAPGLNILSTYIGSNRATATLSGTSMASPHVCGLLTYFLSLQPEADSEFLNGASSGVTPDQLKKRIISSATKDVLSDIPENTPNKLIFNGAGQELASFWNAEAAVESAEWKQVDKLCLIGTSRDAALYR